MPKSKPTQVITHRIEMGEWERQNIGKPVATTVSNAALVTSGGVLLLGGAGVAVAYALWKFWDVFDTASGMLLGDDLVEGGFLSRLPGIGPFFRVVNFGF